MSLQDRIAEARARAEATMDPADWRVVRALEAVQTAERMTPPQPGDTTGIPNSSSAGFVSEVRIVKGGTEN